MTQASSPEQAAHVILDRIGVARRAPATAVAAVDKRSAPYATHWHEDKADVLVGPYLDCVIRAGSI